MNRIQIKEQAKNILNHNIFGNIWLTMLVVFVVQTVVISFIGSVVPYVGALLISGPITYGVSLIVLKFIRTSQKIDFADMLKGFTGDFAQNFLLGFLMSLFIALWSLLFVIPGIVKSYAYSMAFYIKADHPEYDWRQCLDESKRITAGHKMDLFVLDLSFIGWYLVGALCLGVGTFWVMPYHETSKALYYEQLRNI